MRVGHVCALTAGLLLGSLIWSGPGRAWAIDSFTGHMVLHMLVVVGVAPFLALGMRGTRMDPNRYLGSPLHPVPLSLVELVVVWGWHTPGLHHAAQTNGAAFLLEQSTYLVSGFGLWTSILAGDDEARRARTPSSIVALLLTFAHMTLLGALIALADRPLFPAHGQGDLSLTLRDQQTGGVAMLVIGALAYIGPALWLSGGMLRMSKADVKP